jgi:hypothetical protein
VKENKNTPEEFFTLRVCKKLKLICISGPQLVLSSNKKVVTEEINHYVITTTSLVENTVQNYPLNID